MSITIPLTEELLTIDDLFNEIRPLKRSDQVKPHSTDPHNLGPGWCYISTYCMKGNPLNLPPHGHVDGQWIALYGKLKPGWQEQLDPYMSAGSADVIHLVTTIDGDLRAFGQNMRYPGSVLIGTMKESKT